MKRKVYRLERLAQAIKGLFERELGGEALWIKAEVAELKKASSGHIYLNLVEEQNQVRLASFSAVLWKIDYELLEERLNKDLNGLLQQGRELVLKVLLDFHPVYGLKLIIKDIDLNFSLGELERRRKENLKKIEASGQADQNRNLSEKKIWQRIAIISSAEAAALQDFYQHLKENEFGYRYHLKLFPSKVQGPLAALELRKALAKIDPDQFDCVALIRGGGSSLDLDAFNDLDFCLSVTEFPIPVLSGIGHESDWTLLDRVAHSPHKTPTAVADYLIDKMSLFEGQIIQLYQQVAGGARESLHQEQVLLGEFNEVLKSRPLRTIEQQRGLIENRAGGLIRAAAQSLKKQERALDRFGESLKNKPLSFIKHQVKPGLNQLQERIDLLAHHQFERNQQRLQNLGQTLSLLSPEQTLKRGYSITRFEGKSLRDPKGLKAGDRLEIELEKGIIISEIKQIKER